MVIPAERYIKIVGECLRILVKNRHCTWSNHIGEVESFMNYNYNDSTGCLPVELQGEKKCKLKMEEWIE